MNTLLPRLLTFPNLPPTVILNQYCIFNGQLFFDIIYLQAKLVLGFGS